MKIIDLRRYQVENEKGEKVNLKRMVCVSELGIDFSKADDLKIGLITLLGGFMVCFISKDQMNEFLGQITGTNGNL